MIVVVICNIILVKKSIPEFSVFKYINNVILPFFLAFVSLPVLFLATMVESDFIRIFISFLLYIPTLVIITYFWGIDKQTKMKINRLLLSKLYRTK